jgi:TetR/AcrR family transcriptional regulator, mexCD-oprJ operon repressor
VRAKHHPVIARLEPLIARGQREGSFRSDVPAAWHLSMLMALIHAASAELHADRISDAQAEAALVHTVLGAISDGPIALAGPTERSCS